MSSEATPRTPPWRLLAGAAFSLAAVADAHAAQGLRMNNVLPGFIDSLPVKAERVARIPAGRYGTADEVAALVAFLVSAEAAYVNGQNIRIDGGITRSV